MTTITRKVVAYITCGHQLLVFKHPENPEAGIQVPAGTIEENENSQDAVLREAFEETGLKGLKLHRFLGSDEFDLSDHGRNEIQQRTFYQLLCTEDAPVRWQHEERFRSDDATDPVVFELYWVDLPGEVPNLAAGQGALLEQIKFLR